jgi:type IV secretion system protein VirD4
MADKKKKTKDNIDAGGNTWKPPVAVYIFALVLGLYFSIAIAAVYTDEDTIFSLFTKLSATFDNSFIDIGWKEAFLKPLTLFKCAGVVELIIGLFIIFDLSKNRNYMRGKEYGTSQWISPAVINKKFEDTENPHANRIYSDKIRINMDGKKTRINNNVLIIGGSGVGKSMFALTPNLYQADANSRYPGSYIFTDPKGELLLKNGSLLQEKGYKVKVLNLVPGMMQESDGFNPFEYLRTEADIIKLITNLISNTTPKGSSASDPFWEKAETMFLQSLFLIVWMEHDLFNWKMNFNTVLWLLSMADIGDDQKTQSDLDIIFDELVARTKDDPKKGSNHPAYLAYHKVMGGAADTKRSIVISANSRLAIFENPEIKRILEKDELDLSSIGTGLVDGKENVKTALFCVIPDSDTSYNCIAGMMYTLLFQELYFQADFKYKGELPVPVTFWLDEFANIALPNDFLKMLTTMRSRLISCVIIIQNLAQIKGMWEKEWEEIPGNCDVSVYLGGNEQSTFEYISKNLGKKTIWKKSQGESKGSHGSTSTNDDVIGRELMLPEEVRELDNDYCIVFVRGKKPVLDHKYRTFDDANFEHSKKLGSYMHSQRKKIESGIELITSAKLMSQLYKTGDLIEMNLAEGYFDTPDFEELRQISIMNYDEEMEQINKAVPIDIAEYSINEILQMKDFKLSDEELIEVIEGMKNGLSDDEVKSYILYRDVQRMHSKRLLLEAMNVRRQMNG